MYIETIQSCDKGPHFVGSACIHSIESMLCRTSQRLRTNLRDHAGCRIIHPRERTLHLVQQAHTENRVHALWNLSEAAVHEFQRSQSGLPQDLSFPWPAAARRVMQSEHSNWMQRCLTKIFHLENRLYELMFPFPNGCDAITRSTFADFLFRTLA